MIIAVKKRPNSTAAAAIDIGSRVALKASFHHEEMILTFDRD